MKKIGILAFAVILVTMGIAHAQNYNYNRQYDPRSFEGTQTLANDLMQQSRSMYLTAEREFPRFRSDNYVIAQMYRFYDETANFRKKLNRNYDDSDAVRRAYQRVYSAWYNLDYAMQRTNRFGYLNDEFRSASYMVHQLGRSIRGFDYRNDNDYDRDDYDDDY